MRDNVWTSARITILHVRHWKKHTSDDGGPRTRGELRDARDTLIQTAHANGVDVDDTVYALRHDDVTIPDWEIQLTRLIARSKRDS